MAVNIKLDDQIKIKLQEIANEEHRTLSNLISKILIDYLKEKEKPKK
ncbi:MAG TPA: hypothetical protein VMW09_02440 [Desulfatiglandales bacterium]|nr:hypothetical protein [Desulfatiglandales bacterium]